MHTLQHQSCAKVPPDKSKSFFDADDTPLKLTPITPPTGSPRDQYHLCSHVLGCAVVGIMDQTEFDFVTNA